jgi:hypothetical protein
MAPKCQRLWHQGVAYWQSQQAEILRVLSRKPSRQNWERDGRGRDAGATANLPCDWFHVARASGMTGTVEEAAPLTKHRPTWNSPHRPRKPRPIHARSQDALHNTCYRTLHRFHARQLVPINARGGSWQCPTRHRRIRLQQRALDCPPRAHSQRAQRGAVSVCAKLSVEDAF